MIASVLLGTDPPVLPAQLIVRTTELFGISEGATRVALSRMVSAGELTAEEGRYRLAGPLVLRQARQAASRHPALREWDGSWVLAVVPPGARPAAARADLRTALRRARLAELREGVWARPDNLDVELSPEVDRWTGTPEVPPDADVWGLDDWARRAGDLLARMASGGDDLGPSFVLAAAVLRHLQADPLLPPELLPRDWPGVDLRRRYDAYEAAFTGRLQEWFRSAATPTT